MEKIYKRIDGMLDEETLASLQNKKVTVIGLGGVGGLIVEGLARMGVKDITLIDGDIIELSNINRQILYVTKDVGKKKTEVAEQLIHNINESINVNIVSEYIDETNLDLVFKNKPDFIFDAIDDILAKSLVIDRCIKENVKFIVSLGAGKRFNSTNTRVAKYLDSASDGFKKSLSKQLSLYNVDLNKIIVCYSIEPSKKTKLDFVSSLFMVPNSFGLAMLSYFVKEITTNNIDDL